LVVGSSLLVICETQVTLIPQVLFKFSSTLPRLYKINGRYVGLSELG